MMNKTKYGEKKAIKKKKPLYSGIEWTKEQEDRFNHFWIENYGKKINPAWHKLYQSLNGHFDEKYFPEYFYTTKLEPMLNPICYCRVLSDKNMLPNIFGDNTDDLYIPKLYLSCINGIYRDTNGKFISREVAIVSISNIGECVLKPSIETGSGIGVVVANIKNGFDCNNKLELSEIINRLGDNFVVQELIDNNKKIQKICEKSLNTIRLTTYYAMDDIYYVPIALRIGNGVSDVDNIHAGGIGVEINIDGTLKKKAYQLGYGDNGMIYTSHPTSNITFENYYIGDIEKVVNVAKSLHRKIPQLGIISWDFTIDDNDKVILIEANTRDQGVWFPQIISERSLFGDHTEYFCKVIR